MNPLNAFFDRQGVAMLDGGLATEMERRGANLDHELWSAKMLIEAPELIHDVHKAFLEAGADIIATATYQASIAGFERAGHSTAEALALMRKAVDLACAARDTFWQDKNNRQGRLKPLVAASIGPFGACLHDGSEYHGNYDLDKQQLMEFHRPRMALLADTEADVFAFETIPSLREAKALLELLKEFPERQALLSFSCRDGFRVAHGERFGECAQMADRSPQIIAIGVNCTSPKYISDLLLSAGGTRAPLMVYPNSGESWSAESQRWQGEACDGFEVAAWRERGARVIGGCCRTTTTDIRRMRQELLAEPF